MSILLDQSNKVLIQGASGKSAATHIALMRAFGTNIVAGTAPGKGGTEREGLRLYDTVAEARKQTAADTSLIMVPPLAVRDAILEALDAEMPLIVCVTEGVPVKDMLVVFERLKTSTSRLIGPNCPGMVSPGKALAGMMARMLTAPGDIGVMSKSGTLAYEVCHEIVKAGLGQSSWVGIGGDPLRGTRYADLLPLFANDPETRAVVLIGEIGGTDEEQAADLIKQGYPKPVIALISGESAPAGQTMGHAGAIISGNRGSYASKLEALAGAGVKIAKSPADVARLCK